MQVITFAAFLIITGLSPLILGTLYVIEADPVVMRGVSSLLLLLVLISACVAAAAGMLERGE
jgi:hypothetical protein